MHRAVWRAAHALSAARRAPLTADACARAQAKQTEAHDELSDAAMQQAVVQKLLKALARKAVVSRPPPGRATKGGALAGYLSGCGCCAAAGLARAHGADFQALLRRLLRLSPCRP